ncbi:DUF6192 family protein [Streptomyces sp. NBC_00435]|uniref:DUF6192 family protein n=1 Tax=Streptomyces sp. NBC_00435 TaxID=2903649 RepID=UPI002E1B4A43
MNDTAALALDAGTPGADVPAIALKGRKVAADEMVAAQVATDLLRRPDVAFKAMRDNYPDYALAV